MALKETANSLDQRLGHQLNRFSELSEILTLRILDMEERLNRAEEHESINGQESVEATNQLFDETTERFKGLKALLEKQNLASNPLESHIQIPKDAEEKDANLIDKNYLPDNEENLFMDLEFEER